jgi:phosphate transport system protein
MELEIDRLCVEIFVLRQPAAHDLRLVISVAKITPILERIADHASNIADAALIINEEPELNEYEELSLMATKAEEMLQNSLDAFTKEDSAASREIIKQDSIIDAGYKRVFDDLVKIMTKNPAATIAAAQLLFVAKHLERIGDYVTDICELTVYMKEAVFIKHSHEEI